MHGPISDITKHCALGRAAGAETRLLQEFGQLLSSHGISDCDHALELPNGVIRRPLDAPLKQAVTLVVYGSQCVFVTMAADSPDTVGIATEV